MVLIRADFPGKVLWLNSTIRIRPNYKDVSYNYGEFCSFEIITLTILHKLENTV